MKYVRALKSGEHWSTCSNTKAGHVYEVPNVIYRSLIESGSAEDATASDYTAQLTKTAANETRAKTTKPKAARREKRVIDS